MKYESTTRQDTLAGKLIFADDPSARGPEALAAFASTFEEHGFLPIELRANKRSRKYTRRAITDVIAQDRSTSIRFALTRDAAPEWSASFLLRGGSPTPLGCTIRLDFPMSHFAGSEGNDRAVAVVELVHQLCSADRPIYGFLHSDADLELTDDPLLTDSLATNEIRDVYWLLVLGHDMVEQIGRDRVMSTPAARLEPLPQGGVLIVSTESPADVTSPSTRRAQATALAHLRPDITVDAALARYAERDRQLAPVERDWDPDLADLLELICDEVPFGRRQAEIARFNGYRPPAITETRSEPLPPDVPNEAAAIERYELQAEQLVALLHDKVDNLGSAAPDVLPYLDLHFWRYDYPAMFPRSQIETRLVPAVGAYLGDLLVRNLGGRWVPRANADEAQVVIGDRVYLPFLRARHYMESKQTVLDHSLTKLYRVAARVT